MQQKQRGPRLGTFLLVLIVLAGGGIGLLMTKEIPAPQQAVEKNLDVQPFLAQKAP